MAANYLERIAIAGGRTGAPVRPSVTGPPVMPAASAFPLAPLSMPMTLGADDGIRQSAQSSDDTEAPRLIEPQRPPDAGRGGDTVPYGDPAPVAAGSAHAPETAPQSSHRRDGSEGAVPSERRNASFGPVVSNGPVIAAPKGLRNQQRRLPPTVGERTANETVDQAVRREIDPVARPAVTAMPAVSPDVPAAESRTAAAAQDVHGPRVQLPAEMPAPRRSRPAQAPDIMVTDDPGSKPAEVAAPRHPEPTRFPETMVTDDRASAPVEVPVPRRSEPTRVPQTIVTDRGANAPVGLRLGRVTPAETVLPARETVRPAEAVTAAVPVPQPLSPAVRPHAASQRTESRITIGRVEVQVNNLPPPGPDARQPAAARPTAGSLPGSYYLDRFSLRP